MSERKQLLNSPFAVAYADPTQVDISRQADDIFNKIRSNALLDAAGYNSEPKSSRLFLQSKNML